MFFAIPFPNIDPVLIEFGQIGSFPIAVRWYGLLWVVGCIGAWWNVNRYFSGTSNKIEKKYIDDFLIWGILATVIGGRLGYFIFYSEDNFNFFQIWLGGLSFHGGLAGVIFAMLLFTRRYSISFWLFSDAIACSAPIGLFTVRIANFINGELYGRISDLPWAMVFPAGGLSSRLPSQLYEAFFEGLVLFGILYYFSKKASLSERPGTLTGIFLVGYSIARGIIENFRQPDAHLGLLAGGLTMGQWLSFPVLCFGILLIIFARPFK
ncbi:MAG: prolipoprotein diacylglyceryl transferase [Pseudomonadota bacterium]|nr:prolipoprotein diacylglyceryl transferase [Pseudomonadota bacterium]